MSGGPAPATPETPVPPGAYGTPTPVPFSAGQPPAAPSAPLAPPVPPPSPPAYSAPSVARRVVVAVLVSIGFLVLLVAGPEYALRRLASADVGFTTPLNEQIVIGYGLVVSMLYGLRSALRPSRAFGPLTILASLLGVAYLLYLSTVATFAVGVSETVVGVSVGTFVRLLALVPLFGVLSGIVTTVEDVRHPGERLAVDYPARPWARV